MKQKLIEKICIALLKNSYTIKSLTRTCFDILARKEKKILLIKALEDANSISIEYAVEMKKLCGYLDASPLVISESAGQKLEDNIVYSRFGLYTLNFNTFRNSLNNEMPFIKSTHAGLTAHLSGDKLTKKIDEKGLSLNYVSNKIGVSRRMVEKYQKGQADVTINKAIKIRNLFGNNVFEKIDIFASLKGPHEEAKSDVGKKYTELGFEASETKKVPFDIISKKDKEIVLTEISDKTNPQLKPISQLLDAEKLVIFKKKKPKGIPAITKKEFMDFEKSHDLIRFLKEY